MIQLVWYGGVGTRQRTLGVCADGSYDAPWKTYAGGVEWRHGSADVRTAAVEVRRTPLPGAALCQPNTAGGGCPSGWRTPGPKNGLLAVNFAQVPGKLL